MPSSFDNSDVLNAQASYGGGGGTFNGQNVPQANVLSQIGKGVSQGVGKVQSALNQPMDLSAGKVLDTIGGVYASSPMGSISQGIGYVSGGGLDSGASNFTDPARAIPMQYSTSKSPSKDTGLGYAGYGLPSDKGSVRVKDYSQQPQGQVLPQSYAEVVPVNKSNSQTVQQMYKPQQNKKGETQDIYRMVASQYNVSKKPGEITLDKEGILNSFSPQDKAAISRYMYNKDVPYLDKIDFVLASNNLNDKQKASVLALLAHEEGDKSNVLVIHDGSPGGFTVLQFDTVKEKRDFKQAYYGFGKVAPTSQKEYYAQTKKSKQVR